jgi:hypothetical protein
VIINDHRFLSAQPCEMTANCPLMRSHAARNLKGGDSLVR